MQINYAQIRERTGYQDILEALDAYKTSKEPNAAWYCLEIIKPMVNGVVSSYISYSHRIGLGSLVSRDDLTQEAYSYLIRSLNNFEPPEYALDDPDACARSWNRYANLVIKSPIRERYAASINQVDVPNWAIKISKRISRAISDIESEHFYQGGNAENLGHRPDPIEIARRTELPYSKVKRFLDHGFDMLPQQRFARTGPSINDNEKSQRDELEDRSAFGQNPEIQFSADESELLTRVWQLLDQRQQAVLSARFGIDGPAYTLKAAAEHFELSVKQIRLIEAKALAKIREALLDLEHE